MKKLVSLLLIVVMMFGVSVVAFATENDKEYLFEDKFIERYVDTVLGELDSYGYNEIYYHYNENNELDWVLVGCFSGAVEPWFVQQTVGNRLIEASIETLPFSLGMAIYDVKADGFCELTTDALSKYIGLEDALSELKLGRVIGDVDNDNELTIFDATFIQRVVAKLAQYDEDDYIGDTHSVNDDPVFYLSDYNRDGERSILDATAIQRAVAKLEPRPDISEVIMQTSNDYEQFNNLPEMPEDAQNVVCHSEHEKSQFGITMYNREYFGEIYSVAVIDTLDKYKLLFNEEAPQYDEEFFMDNSLVISLTMCSNLSKMAPIEKLAIQGDTLYVRSNPIVYKDGMAAQAIQMWLSIVSVDKDNLTDIKNIVKVK